MSIQRAGNGTIEHTPNHLLDDIAHQVVECATFTLRLTKVVERLADRVDLLESNAVADRGEDPLPADFDIEVDLTDEGRAVLEDQPAEADIELDEPAATEEAEVLSDAELRVSIPQKDLLQSLKVVTKAITRGPNPILQNVRFQVNEGELVLSATDGDLSVAQTLRIEASTSADLLIPGKLLLDAVQGLPKEDLTLDFHDKAVHIDHGGASVFVPTTSADEFPAMPVAAGDSLVSLGCYELSRMLNRVGFAAVRESSTRGVHYTNAVLLNLVKGGMEVASTDGHRLAVDRVELSKAPEEDQPLLIPYKAAKILGQLLPDEATALRIYRQKEQLIVTIPAYTTGSRVRKRVPPTQVVCSLVDLKYPDYERVFPKKFESKVEVERKPLIGALKRVLMVCKQKDQNPVAHFTAEGNVLSIKADAGDSGQAEEKLHASGGDLQAALNPQYVLDALNAVDGETVAINWVSETNPVTITCGKHPNFRYVVMPIRMD